MSRTARSLIRYRALLGTLTNRELKARYRGSLLGWAWSFANPVVLLAVYSFVFTVIFPNKEPALQPYALFLVTGLFPWIWFQASLLEGSGALIANAGLIRKATFPAELLPVVPVLANLVHFAFALPIIGAALLFARFHAFPVSGPSALLMPLVVLIQLPMVVGATLALAALNAHFKDVKDMLNNLMTLLFFGTPILYSMSMLDEHPWPQRLVTFNPVTPFIRAYQDTLFFGQVPSGAQWLVMVAISTVTWFLGTMVFDRLRDTLVEAV